MTKIHIAYTAPINPPNESLKLTRAQVWEGLKLKDSQIATREVLEEQQKANSDSWSTEEWTWERIEQERIRGLAVVDGYINLDDKLNGEWA